MRVIEWEIKVSKLCNLRCSYCYEFPELSNPRRLSLEEWRSILASASWYQHEISKRNPQQQITTRFVWHGGEPTLLPLSYYQDVLALQRDVLGTEQINTVYFNHIPTNLYAIHPDLLAFFKQEQFRLAVSFDAISGVRVNTANQPTETRVENNMKNLLADGWRLGCNLVLAAHTVPHLPQIYEQIRDLVLNSPGHLYLNIIPLHKTPTDDGNTPFSLDETDIVETLLSLFEQWLADEAAIAVMPLRNYYLNVMRKLMKLPRYYFDRRYYGESSLMVNTDGHVYIFGEAYDADKSLGCLFEKSFQEIMQSQPYEASLQRQEANAAQYCHTCPYNGYCNHEPLLSSPRVHTGERCAIGFALHQKIEAALAARGITAETLKPSQLSTIPQFRFLAA